MRVMIVVTHLLGTGHLSRVLTLGRAFSGAGHDVEVLSGGMPAPQLDHTGVEVRQLPPLRSDGTNFTDLLDAAGTPAGPDVLAARRAALAAALNDDPPDVVITELFPFGRRVLSDEFLSLLDAARRRARPPIVLASIRDILAPPSKPARVTRTDEIIARYYDGVLVHSDPRVAPLELSWPVSSTLDSRVHYTGYVAPPAPKVQLAPTGEVLVSAGGGSVGAALFRAAIDAARLMPDVPWRILIGGADATSEIARLKTLAQGSRVTVEPARRDFRALLTGAAASLSMCGYNTALDLLQTGVPAVVVPFDAGGEVEQSLRAKGLARLQAVEIVPSATLTPQTIEQALIKVMALGPRATDDLRFDGADESVRIATRMVEARAC
ncbi:glycosyltransferase family protein [Arenibacterium sp. CAU 1754]